ncbi:MAG: hypothetical protein IJT01_01240, partial [Selenomonadaceae bacterium]|nr:hypothetical protein [Selenomonadaceae bacterium]
MYFLAAIASSGPKTHTAERYEDVAHFVTREAPFDVYDALRPLSDGLTKPGRLAFFLLLHVAPDAPSGDSLCVLTLKAGPHAVTLPLTLRVSAAVVPPLEKARLGMVNWLSLDDIEQSHRVSRTSDAFWEIVANYID